MDNTDFRKQRVESTPLIRWSDGLAFGNFNFYTNWLYF